jgi:hypothetical protein
MLKKDSQAYKNREGVTNFPKILLQKTLSHAAKYEKPLQPELILSIEKALSLLEPLGLETLEYINTAWTTVISEIYSDFKNRFTTKNTIKRTHAELMTIDLIMLVLQQILNGKLAWHINPFDKRAQSISLNMLRILETKIKTISSTLKDSYTLRLVVTLQKLLGFLEYIQNYTLNNPTIYAEYVYKMRFKNGKEHINPKILELHSNRKQTTFEQLNLLEVEYVKHVNFSKGLRRLLYNPTNLRTVIQYAGSAAKVLDKHTSGTNEQQETDKSFYIGEYKHFTHRQKLIELITSCFEIGLQADTCVLQKPTLEEGIILTAEIDCRKIGIQAPIGITKETETHTVRIIYLFTQKENDLVLCQLLNHYPVVDCLD